MSRPKTGSVTDGPSGENGTRLIHSSTVSQHAGDGAADRQGDEDGEGDEEPRRRSGVRSGMSPASKATARRRVSAAVPAAPPGDGDRAGLGRLGGLVDAVEERAERSAARASSGGGMSRPAS